MAGRNAACVDEFEKLVAGFEQVQAAGLGRLEESLNKELSSLRDEFLSRDIDAIALATEARGRENVTIGRGGRGRRGAAATNAAAKKPAPTRR